MHVIVRVLCLLIVGMGLASAPAFAESAADVQKKLQGAWSATKAERDGKSATDVIGHRLTFSGNRFQIRSTDGKSVFAGTYQLMPGAKPSAIDFKHTEGSLKGKVWKGIYSLNGNALVICDNAEDIKKDRPIAFEAKAGSAYIVIMFARAKP